MGKPVQKLTVETDLNVQIIFEAKGKFIKTYIDGKLLVETKDKAYKNGRLGLGDRDSTLFTIILRSMALA